MVIINKNNKVYLSVKLSVFDISREVLSRGGTQQLPVFYA